MTRNGKIARLPQTVQEELNRRLDDHEQGKKLVAWLNSLPEVRAVLAADFHSQPIREQNLSEWKHGGYRDWQQRQERRELFRQMQAESGDLTAFMAESEFNRQLKLQLKTNLALATRDIMEHVADPAKRAESLAALAGKFAQLRREESNADRVQNIQEKWKRELEAAEDRKRVGSSFLPENALLFQRIYLDSFGPGHGRATERQANGLAGGPFNAAPASSRPANPAESD